MKYLVVIFSLLLSILGYSAEIHLSTRMVGGTVLSANAQALQVGSKTLILDQDFNGVLINSYVDKTSYGYVELGIDERFLMDFRGTDALDIWVSVKIKRFSMNGDLLGTDNQTMKINGDLTSQGINVNSDIFRMPNVHHFEVEVTEIKVNGVLHTPSTSLPNYIYLESGFYAERYYNLSLTAPSIGLNLINYATTSGVATENVTFSAMMTTSTTDELEFTWDYVAGAEYYELEWSWIDNYGDNGSISANQLNLSERDFGLNHTKIRTSKQFYRIPQIFSKGYVVYRVRAVGRWSDALNKEKYGDWSGTGVLKHKVSNWTYVQITSEHEKYKNWQYQATYAEDGKKKEVTQYFDGSLRSRQTVTRINSSNQSVVGETIYDNEGRGVIQILPVPQNNPAIRYYPELNLNESNTVPFNHKDFDWEDAISSPCTPVMPQKMGSSSGAGAYYSSSAHDSETNWQQYVPDAKGYPYTQVEYTPDNTNRIRNQSGVGDKHQIGSGHQTSYYYSQPSQMELDRLFGYKAGKNNRYQKNMVIDANGQVSVSYLDAQGRVIATSLAGESPKENGINMFTSIPSGNSYLNNDILGNSPSSVDQSDDNNILSSSGRFGSNDDVLQVSSQLVVTKDNTTYNFTYDAVSHAYVESCPATNLNSTYPVFFDVKLSLKDDCGNEYFVPGSPAPSPTPLSLLNTETEVTTKTADFTVALNKGTYTLYKELRINETKLKAAKALYLSSYNSCFQSDFNNLLIDSDGPCGPTTCEACLTELGTESAYIDRFKSDPSDVLSAEDIEQAQALYQQALEDCKELCVGINDICGVLEQMLSSDMRPYGQYGGGSVGNFTTDPLSVYNSNNTNNWKSSLVTYTDQIEVFYDGTIFTPALQTPITISLPPANTSMLLDPKLLTLEAFIQNFNPSWAKDMLPLHPENYLMEYKREQCNLTFAVAGSTVPMSSTEFDQTLKDFHPSAIIFNGTNSAVSIPVLRLSNPLNPAIPTTSDNINVVQGGNLMANDPYFQIVYPKHTLINNDFNSQASSLSIHSLKTAMMTYALNNKYKSTNMPMLSFAVYTIKGSTMGLPSVSPQWSDVMSNTSLTAADKAAIWEQYKSMYLSYKGLIDQLIMDLYGCKSGIKKFNGSIGDKTFSYAIFNNYQNLTSPASFVNIVLMYRDLVNYSIFTSSMFWWNTIFSMDLPLGLSEPAYDTKEIRFVRQDALYNSNVDDLTAANELAEQAGYAVWEQTGLCPEAFKFQNFLNAMAQSNQLVTTAPLTMQTMPYFTQDLYTEFTSMPFNTASNMSITGTATATGLTLLFDGNVGTNGIVTLADLDNGTGGDHYDWNIGYGSTWRVVSISDMFVQADAGSIYTSKVLIKAQDLDGSGQLTGAVKEFVVSFTTPFSFNKCKEIYTSNNSISADCKKEEQFENAMLNLTNYLMQTPIYSGPLYNGSGIDIHNMPLYQNTILKDYFGPTAYFWANPTVKITPTTSGLINTDYGIDFGFSIPSDAVSLSSFNVDDLLTPTPIASDPQDRLISTSWITTSSSTLVVSNISHYAIYHHAPTTNIYGPSLKKLNFNCSACCYEIKDNEDVSERMKNLLNYLLHTLPTGGIPLASLENTAPGVVSDIAPFVNSNLGDLVIYDAVYNANTYNLSFKLKDLVNNHQSTYSFYMPYCRISIGEKVNVLIESVSEFIIHDDKSYTIVVSYTNGEQCSFSGHLDCLNLNPCEETTAAIESSNSDLLQVVTGLFNDLIAHPDLSGNYLTYLQALQPYSPDPTGNTNVSATNLQITSNSVAFHTLPGGHAFYFQNTSLPSIGSPIVSLSNMHYTYMGGFTATATRLDGTSIIVQGNLNKIVNMPNPQNTFENEDCKDCKPEQLEPISCNTAYSDYSTLYNVRFTQGLPFSEVTTIINDYKASEADFCESQYGYIYQSYFTYCNAFSITSVTDLRYLSLSQFGATPLGYSNSKLEAAIIAYQTYLNAFPVPTSTSAPAKDWNDYVTNVYMSEHPEICPSSVPQTPMPTAIDNAPCNSLELNGGIANVQNQQTIYLDQAGDLFEQNYLKWAMSSLEEHFREKHQDNEYHYTLYYYDRAGNLVQTVPPKGVKRMNYASDGTPTPMTNSEGLPQSDGSFSSADIEAARGVFDKSLEGTSADPAPKHDMKTIYRYNSLNQLVYQKTPDGGESRFAYDRLGRLVVSQNAKQLNNSITIYTENQLGEQVGHKDNMRQFSYTLYDALGRVYEVGEANDYLNLVIDDKGILVTSNNVPYNVNSANWINVNHTQREEVTRTIYDKLGPVTATLSSSTPTLISTMFGSNYGVLNTRNRIVGVVYYDNYVGGTTDLNAFNNGTFYDYDIHGNVKHMIQVNQDPNIASIGHGVKHVEYEYDLVSGNVNKVIYQKGFVDQFIHRYQYDSDNRITIAETSSDNIHYEKDAKYFYYDHGPLARTEIGEQKVQAEDYVYTIQGWLKSVNGEKKDPTTMMGYDGSTIGLTSLNNPNKNIARDAFGYSLSYFQGDYASANTEMLNYSQPTPTPGTAPDLGQNLYNGNIRSMHTTISDLTVATAGFYETHKTKYSYDPLNRISSMAGTKLDGTGNFISSGYSSSYSYDANGNLKTMTNDAVDATGVSKHMDNFVYNYPDPSKNRLASVSDDISYTGNFDVDVDNQPNLNNYMYDEIGQLVQDKAEHISKISWTVTNKVKEVIYENNTNGLTGKRIKFDYDALGNRIAKHLTHYHAAGAPEQTTSTYYVLDAQGNPMSTYEFNNFNETNDGGLANKLYLSDRNIYGSSRIGVENVNKEMTSLVQSNNGTILMNLTNLTSLTSLSSLSRLPSSVHFSNVTGDKSYELSNHLGNVLSVISDKKLAVDENSDGTVDYYLADIVSYSDYYPFGVLMPGRHGSSSDYAYGFQGQLEDDEIKGEGNSVNYKYRMHDPRIGRFFAVDPLAAKYSYNSPYAFSENVVISHVELEGLEKSVYLNVVANDGKKRGVSLTDSWSIQSYWAYVVLNQNNITWVGDSRQQYLGSWNGWNGSSDDLDGCRNGSAGSCDSHLKNNGILWLTLDAKTQKYKASYQYNQERPPKGYASWEELKEAGENIESGGAIMKYIGLGIAIIAPEIGLPLAETGAAIETSGELMQIGAGIGKNGVTTETVTDATFILAPKPLKEIVNANSPAKEIIVEAAVDATQDKVNQKRGSKKNR